MPSAKVPIALLVGLLVLAHPVVGNGPGPDDRYRYSVSTVDLSNDESVERLYYHPSVAYGSGPVLRAVRDATDDPITAPRSTVDSAVLDLADRRYVADDPRDRYYRVDTARTDDDFRLSATPVSAATVAERVAVAPDAVDPLVADVLDGQETASRRVAATVVERDDRYLLVRTVETASVPDPLAPAKLAAYALGVVLVVWAAVRLLHRRDGGAGLGS